MRLWRGLVVLIAFELVGLAAAAFSPPVASIALSTFFIAATAIILLILFSSILARGLGTRRSVSGILLLSSAGIGAIIFHFAVLYRELGLTDPSGAITRSLADAIYFSVVTWTTLGYGDFLPAQESRVVVIIEALMGYITMALLISALGVALIAKQTRVGSG